MCGFSFPTSCDIAYYEVQCNVSARWVQGRCDVPGRTVALLRETVSHLRDLPRYRQILATLVRYGYQDVVAALHLEGLVRPLERVALGGDVPPQDRARRLRLICEDLGPTFVKLGQVLSTRPDLLPEAYTNELSALRDDV